LWTVGGERDEEGRKGGYEDEKGEGNERRGGGTMEVWRRKENSGGKEEKSKWETSGSKCGGGRGVGWMGGRGGGRG